MTDPARDVFDGFVRVDALLRELAVPHAFMGAMAVMAWGKTRATTDVDCVVVLREGDWERLDQAFRDAGFQPGRHQGPVEPSDRMPDPACYWLGPVRIDVFIAKTAFEQAAVESGRPTQVQGFEQLVVSPEASIVYKVLAHRAKDLLDVASIFEARKIAGDALDWSFIDHWCAEWGITDRLAPWRAQYGPG